MIKKTLVYCLFILFCVLVTTCGKHKTVAPFGWERVDAETDSLMLRLEWHWLHHDDDTLIYIDLDSLQRMAAANPGDRLLAVRNHYWQGRMALRHEDYDTADSLFALGLALNDSTAHPYETYRLRWTTETDPLPYTIDTYNYLLDQAEFFEKTGDNMLASSRWMDLGMMLNDLGLYNRADEMLARSDSLSRLGGFKVMLAGNRINHAKVKYRAGDSASATRMLREVLDDSTLQLDPLAVNIVLDNLYMIGGDTTALFMAYDMASNNPGFDAQRPYYHGCLTEVYLRRGMTDSALVHARQAANGFEMIETTRQQVDVMMWRAEAERAAGNSARACVLYDSAQLLTEQYIDETRADEVFNYDFHHQLTELERKHDRSVFRHKIINVIVAASLFTLLLGGALIFYRRWSQLRFSQVRQQLDLEKSQRRLMAMKLNLQSKEALIASIDKGLEGDSIEARQHVKSAIRTYEATTGKQAETFEQLFSELHPAFVERVREQWPTLTDNDIRLLSLIALKLSNRQIASVLGIRPESVKQARWRLRTKMQLTAECSLEHAIDTML